MVYFSSEKYQCSELQEAARTLILANFVAVTKSNDFLNLSVSEVGHEKCISSVLSYPNRKLCLDLQKKVRCIKQKEISL